MPGTGETHASACPPSRPRPPPLHRRLRWQRALGSPAVLDRGGRRWRVAIGRLAGVRVTVSDERTGEVPAREVVRTLDVTGGPRTGCLALAAAPALRLAGG